MTSNTSLEQTMASTHIGDSPPSPLGLLARAPSEVRAIIYHYYFTVRRHRSIYGYAPSNYTYDSRRLRLALLRTSKTVSSEARLVLYKHDLSTCRIKLYERLPRRGAETEVPDQFCMSFASQVRYSDDKNVYLRALPVTEPILRHMRHVNIDLAVVTSFGWLQYLRGLDLPVFCDRAQLEKELSRICEQAVLLRSAAFVACPDDVDENVSTKGPEILEAFRAQLLDRKIVRML